MAGERARVSRRGRRRHPPALSPACTALLALGCRVPSQPSKWRPGCCPHSRLAAGNKHSLRGARHDVLSLLLPSTNGCSRLMMAGLCKTGSLGVGRGSPAGPDLSACGPASPPVRLQVVPGNPAVWTEW